ncbi:MarR family winged helix-turn-helix transcriptional regulator [Microbacterium sp. GXF7504]
MDAADSPTLAADLRLATFRLGRRLRAQRVVDTVTDSQLAVLAALLWGGLRTLGELADGERVTPPSMNRTVNCLEEAGYITRTPDAEDRRRVLIEVTDAGRRLMEETQRRRDAWLEDALAELTPAQRSALVAAVPVMRQVAER